MFVTISSRASLRSYATLSGIPCRAPNSVRVRCSRSSSESSLWSLILTCSVILYRPKIVQRQNRDIIRLRRSASEMPYVADQIADDLARGRAQIISQEPFETLIGIERLARVHGLGYPIGVKQQRFAGTEHGPSRLIRASLHEPQGVSPKVFQGTDAVAVKTIGQIVPAVAIIDLTRANIQDAAKKGHEHAGVVVAAHLSV